MTVSSKKYAALAQELRRPPETAASDRATELVRAATLAANGHNTQPWSFEISDSRVVIRPDLDRRTPVVDPDDHHLYASLGCAAENLVLAATVYGLASEVTSSADGIEIDLACEGVEPSPLVRQIVVRQCTRGVYGGRTSSYASGTAPEPPTRYGVRRTQSLLELRRDLSGSPSRAAEADAPAASDDA